MIRVLVVAPAGSTRAPTLRIGGGAAGVTAESLAGKESIALVIDRSQAMRGIALAEARRAAAAFVTVSPATDQVSLMGVASRPTTLSSFSAGGAAVLSALRALSLDPRTGTALWQALIQAAESLHTHAVAGRVVVLLAAGRNSDPAHTVNDAIQAARRAQTVVYVIGVPNRELVYGRWVTLGHRWYTPKPLQQLAAATGGQFFPAPSSTDLPAIYQAIGAELRRTWQFTFATSARPGDTVTLTASTGSSSATTTERLPSTLPTPRATQGGLNAFLLLAVSVIALFALAIGASHIRTATRRRWRGRSTASF